MGKGLGLGLSSGLPFLGRLQASNVKHSSCGWATGSNDHSLRILKLHILILWLVNSLPFINKMWQLGNSRELATLCQAAQSWRPPLVRLLVRVCMFLVSLFCRWADEMKEGYLATKYSTLAEFDPSNMDRNILAAEHLHYISLSQEKVQRVRIAPEYLGLYHN